MDREDDDVASFVEVERGRARDKPVLGIVVVNPTTRGAQWLPSAISATPSTAFQLSEIRSEKKGAKRGCDAPRTNITDWDAELLWRTYIQLSEAEAAFRIHKSELSIRPIWHQRADRVQAHILVCFLAYVLWKTLEQWQSRAGLGNSPRTILDELGRIQSTDVVLPLAEDPSRKLRIRCVARPDDAQAALLDRLGLRLPERLRPPPSMREM